MSDSNAVFKGALDAMQRAAERLHGNTFGTDRADVEEILEGIATFQKVLPNVLEAYDNYIWLFSGHSNEQIIKANEEDRDPDLVIQDEVIAYLASHLVNLSGVHALILNARSGG